MVQVCGYGLNYDENTKILSIFNENGIRGKYYDLTKYFGQEITISFKAKTDDNTQLKIIEKNDTSSLTTAYYNHAVITDLENSWKEYSYTIKLDRSGYIGLLIQDNEASVEIQDLQIELGNTKTNYEEFRYTYNANIGITVNDIRNEITTNDYYIKIYKNNEQTEEYRYEELGEENKVENILKNYEVDQNSTYKIELLIKVSDQYYELDSVEFTTENTKEIKGISNEDDFKKIQPYGEYIVLNDLDFSGGTSANNRFGNSLIQFQGKIDFNGKTLTRDMSTNNAIIYTNGENGVIENIVFDINFNNALDTNINGSLTYNNYGTIKNIQINLSSNDTYNTSVYLLAFWNYGIIENFVLNLETEIYVDTNVGLITRTNYNVVRNGYIYGEDIQSLRDPGSGAYYIGTIALSNERGGLIENIFVLTKINLGEHQESYGVGNLVYSNTGNSTIQNVYSVGLGENTTNFANGPNIYLKSSTKIYNNYYFADAIFTDKYETKGNMLSLWDSEFQNQLINGGGAFIVDELVNEGYYPQIDMPEVMPLQEYIELPEVEDADLPDILSTKIVEQGSNTVKVEFSVNNPSAEQISNIQIEYIEVEILSQEYSNGKSKVIAELKNPVMCLSSYNVLSISTRGAFNSTYTREYEEGERTINVSLYNEIWNIEDWRNINQSPSENYMLMTNLNFINEGNNIALSNIHGIFEGNGFTISNVRLPSGELFIGALYGTIRNLNIENYIQESSAFGGVVGHAYSGSIIDNVHMTDVNIIKTGSGYAGGLVCQASYSMIRNCSINNIEINTNIDWTPDTLGIGGLAGNIDNTTIENCYVQGININDVTSMSPAIGGMVGDTIGANTINNSYVTGNIKSNNINVGGLVGSFNGNIQNCFSKVNISTTNNNVGGIIGFYTGTNIGIISNNLSIGNIYSTSGVDVLNRIVGNNVSITNNNYAYEKQLLNGYKTGASEYVTLLDEQEILNLDLGDSYNYDKKDEGILPKIYNTDGTEILPNQVDIKITNETEEQLEIENIEATKPNTTEAEINVRLKNPDELEITGIKIEDMELSITRNITQNGETNITLRATPERFYDSYKLTEIRYRTNNSDEEQVKKVEAEIKVQFYKELYTYEDWQAIEEGTYQNYRLMADIDFSGRTNINNNITVNRLEAENNTYTLKNITLEFNKGNVGLINNIKTSMKNIAFENITLKNTINSAENFGIILSNSGELENLKFTNINIEAARVGIIGIIGREISGNITNVELDNIKITGLNNIGGLIGFTSIESGTSINKITRR